MRCLIIRHQMVLRGCGCMEQAGRRTACEQSDGGKLDYFGLDYGAALSF